MNADVTLDKLVKNVKNKFNLKTEQQALEQLEYIVDNAEPELKVSKAFHKKLDKIKADMDKGNYTLFPELQRAKN